MAERGCQATERACHRRGKGEGHPRLCVSLHTQNTYPPIQIRKNKNESDRAEMVLKYYSNLIGNVENIFGTLKSRPPNNLRLH